MPGLDEQFGAHLVRVIKNVRRRTSDGRTKTVKQSFHVRQANPGDQYLGGKGGNGIPKLPRIKLPKLQSVVPGLQDPAAEPDPAAEQPVEPVTRMTVRYHDIPWGKTKVSKEVKDPVPSGIRDRYEKGNRHAQVPKPMKNETPLASVLPTDRVLWGYDEPETLERMRSGMYERMSVIGRDSGMLIGRLRSFEGTTLTTYMFPEALRDPLLHYIWGDLYELGQGDGSVSKRAAAAYEVAKATGFDDLVPPTVARFDEYGDLDRVLPSDLIERKKMFFESIARRTGEHPDAVRNQLSGGHSAVQLVRGDTHTIESERWFETFFQVDGEVNRKDVLNHVFDYMSDAHRVALVRVAALDFILWTGDRHLGDLAFCPSERHPLHLIGNEVCIPCPRKMGQQAAETGMVDYVTSSTDPKMGIPMLWCEPSTMLAARGGERELKQFEDIGQYVVSRMKGDRAVEMARSLSELEVSALGIAGVLSRVWLLGTHYREFARNPLAIAKYYADIISGNSIGHMEGVTKYVNQVMQQVLVSDFDFVSTMRGEEEHMTKDEGDDTDREGPEEDGDTSG